MTSAVAVFPRVSINCDMGEGFAKWKLGPDEELMPLIDFANIACGFHAGDQNTMLRTVRSAIKHNVKIGAHPGLDDIKGFGRRAFAVSEEEVYALALYQIGALKAIVEAEGGKLSHVKVHGALYFIFRDHPSLLRSFLKAQISFSPDSPLPFVGLAGTPHEEISKEMGVPFVPELFCDIDYDKSGKLLSVPESRAPTEALIRERLARVLTKGETLDNDNNPLKLPFLGRSFTICLHSDMPTALANVMAARQIVDEHK
ncbi:hypothetical protein I312_105875 [Cryptococcus bacillisporus CA1280]